MVDELSSVLPLIVKLISRQDLTIGEAEQLFTTIFLNDTEGYFFTALVVALHTKGETADELMGLINSSAKLGEKIVPNVSANLLTDLAGTGGSLIKTINISTAASLIVAAAGFTVAKFSGYAQTSATGSADVFNAFGVDVFKLSKQKVEEILEKIGICPFFLSALSPKMKNRSIVARKIFVEKGLGIPSPFHLVAFAYSPTPLKKRIYGCYSEEYLEILAKLFVKMGNERTFIIHGVGGLPEASVIGKTILVEQLGKKITKSILNPSDFGLPTYKKEEIESGGKDQNLIDFLRIIYSKSFGAKRDMVLANAALSLMVMGDADNPLDGAKKAVDILNQGLAARKLEKLVNYVGDVSLLNAWKAKAGI